MYRAAASPQDLEDLRKLSLLGTGGPWGGILATSPQELRAGILGTNGGGHGKGHVWETVFLPGGGAGEQFPSSSQPGLVCPPEFYFN